MKTSSSSVAVQDAASAPGNYFVAFRQMAPGMPPDRIELTVSATCEREARERAEAKLREWSIPGVWRLQGVN